MNYHQCFTTLNGRASKKIANNTVMRMAEEQAIVIELHSNPIMRFYPDGNIQLDSCGYHTATTKDRFNRYLPYGVHVYQEQFQWYISTPLKRAHPFHDGITVNYDSLAVWPYCPSKEAHNHERAYR